MGEEKGLNERNISGFVIKKGILIPPRKRQSMAHKNTCTKRKCPEPGYIVCVKKRDQKNFMTKTYCLKHIGLLVTEDSCAVKPRRISD